MKGHNDNRFETVQQFAKRVLSTKQYLRWCEFARRTSPELLHSMRWDVSKCSSRAGGMVSSSGLTDKEMKYYLYKEDSIYKKLSINWKRSYVGSMYFNC